MCEKSSLRIIIVDDEPDMADSLAMVLQPLGHEIITTYGGEQAMEKPTPARRCLSSPLHLRWSRMRGRRMRMFTRRLRWWAIGLGTARAGRRGSIFAGSACIFVRRRSSWHDPR